MSSKFRNANYEDTLNQTIRLGDALPDDHLARFVVDIIAQLDLSKVYEQFAPRGGEAIAPEILLGLAFYGYVAGIFSSRKIEKATLHAHTISTLSLFLGLKWENIPIRPTN